VIEKLHRGNCRAKTKTTINRGTHVDGINHFGDAGVAGRIILN
jgi:hypothetical protein